MKFDINGGTKTVNYTLGCADGSNIDFAVSYKEGNPTGWLSVEKVSGEKKVKVTALKNDYKDKRIGYVTAVINGNCTEKSLLVEQTIDGNSCDCNVSIFDSKKAKLIWANNQTGVTQTVDIENAFCPIKSDSVDIQPINADFNNHFTLSFNQETSTLSITSGDETKKPNGSTPFTSTLYISYKIDDTQCEKENSKKIDILWEVVEQTSPDDGVSQNFNADALDPNGAVGQEIGNLKARSKALKLNPEEYSVNTSGTWIDAELGDEYTDEDGYSTIPILATYGATTVSRKTTIGVSRSGKATGEPADKEQPPTIEIVCKYEITKEDLDPCGRLDDVIGTYYYTGTPLVDTASFSFVGYADRPDWINSIGFGTAVPYVSDKGEYLNEGYGSILISYERNYLAERTYTLGDLRYGIKNVTALETSKGKLTQETPTSPNKCGAPITDLPSTCEQVNFFHDHHPYVPGDGDYYYLEHDISSRAQDYELMTNCEGVDEHDTRRICDDMWEDVRVEIWDIKPRLVHRSACGSHYVDTTVPGIEAPTFEQIKEEHERIDGGQAVHCPCWTGSVHSGEYVIEGYEESSKQLIAYFEGTGFHLGPHITMTDYNNFWFKFKGTVGNHGVNISRCYYNHDCNHEEGECDYRGIDFTVGSNVGQYTIERCVIVKVYPKVGGQYCNGNTCEDCESSGSRCPRHRNSCITDLIVQEAVHCGDSEEYFDPNHAYFSRYITTKRNEALTDQGLYQYWWGPCNDCWHGDTMDRRCDGTSTPYMSAVDIYEATMIDACQDQKNNGQWRKLDNCNSNTVGDYKIGDYLGTVYADNDYSDIVTKYGRKQFVGDACIKNVTFKCEYDSEKNQYRGVIKFSANAYTPSGKIYKYGDPNRYRVRILVPYHKGVDYTTGNSGCLFTKNEQFFLYYGPKSINYPNKEDGTFEWIGLTNGEFCVLRQDGLNN